MLWIANVVSLICLGVVVLLLATSPVLDPWEKHISITDGFHVGVWKNGWDAQLVFFDNATYGPYRGSIIDCPWTDAEGNVHSLLSQKVAFGDTWGIYYRYFRWPDNRTLWTLAVSLWYFLPVCSTLPLVSMIRKRRARSATRRD
jgi:hypothetical protein